MIGTHMNRAGCAFFTIVFLTMFAACSYSMEGRLFRYPDIGSDRIVFTYENDLWIVNSAGGTARRITTHPGWEGRAKFSPDGKNIAFTGNYDGGWDVYTIPSEGGEPERMTYHPGTDFLVDWSVDGKYLMFRSRRTDPTGSNEQLYRVAASGGYPEKMPVDMVRYAAPSPDGTKLAYNRYASDSMNWKGYKGGRQQDIWVTDLSGRNFEKITDWEGYDNYPMWHNSGIFFDSDREDGRMNLYHYDPAARKTTRKTFEREWDVRYPSIGGDRIVYVIGGHLRVFDIRTGTDTKVGVEIPSERLNIRDRYIDPDGYMESVSLSTDGGSAAVCARGDIYILDRDNEKGFDLTATPGSREINPAYSPDGERVAFFSDRTGEYELYVAGTEAGAEWDQITSGSSAYYYEAYWSPDGEKLLYGDKDYNIYYVDIEKKKPVMIDRSLYQKDNEIFWKYRDYTWSPDSKWIAYSLVEENLNSSIFLYELKSGSRTRLTDDRFDDFSPSFDPSGNHLFFLSIRNFEPMLDPFMDNNVVVNATGIFLFQLQSGHKPPFLDGWGEEEEGDENGEEKDEDEIPRIEPEGIEGRLFVVPVETGTYKDLEAGDGQLFYLARSDYGFPSLDEFFNPQSITAYDLNRFDLEEEEAKSVTGSIGDYSLSPDGSKVVYRSGSIFGVVDAGASGGSGTELISLSPLRQRVDVLDEYRQMFVEAWRQLRDFFYDPGMHGQDWGAMREKYEPLLEFVGDKSDLDFLLGEMTGELTASHEYIFGGPEVYDIDYVSVGLLGADLVPDEKSDAYRFTHILKGEGWNSRLESPLVRPDQVIEEGDYLFAIDGIRVSSGENYLKHLVDKGGREITVTVGRTPDPSKAADYRIQTLYSESALRYNEWVTANRKKVEAATGGRVGYMHLTDMDEEGLEQFERDFRAFRYRDGLIIDVRENGGGFVSWFIIDKLERQLLYYTRTRDFKVMRYPHGVHSGPMIVVCNAGTGSDGEIFTQHFKDLGLGKVVGMPTWGGLIGIINMIPLVDGTMITQPNVGFYDAKGNWIVENRGAEPDIEVPNDPASTLAGRDLQLDKAIDLVFEEIADFPPEIPQGPPFPVK